MKIIKIVLPLLLFAISSINVFADPARVVSKQENLPDGGKGNIKTRLFLDITPNDGNDRADAYVDITRINRFMSLQEFSDMIQVDDIIEYKPDEPESRDGRYFVIRSTNLLDLNGKNIYEIFSQDLGDRDTGFLFHYANLAYEARVGH